MDCSYFVESLDELEAMVAPLYSQIVNKNREKLQYHDPPWGPEQLQKKVYYVPIADFRQLTIRFPLPWVEGDYKTAVILYRRGEGTYEQFLDQD